MPLWGEHITSEQGHHWEPRVEASDAPSAATAAAPNGRRSADMGTPARACSACLPLHVLHALMLRLRFVLVVLCLLRPQGLPALSVQ